jgi:hypothetical protein
LLAAVTGFEAMKVPYEVARTREELARLLTGDDAREQRRAASDVYRRLGARTGLGVAGSRIPDHTGRPAGSLT